jgi:hypothetical protein
MSEAKILSSVTGHQAGERGAEHPLGQNRAYQTMAFTRE